jgi:hypothetical protein
MIIHDCVASETHYFAACRLQACQKGWSLSIMSGPFAATSISSSKMPYGAPADVKPTTNMRRPETSHPVGLGLLDHRFTATVAVAASSFALSACRRRLPTVEGAPGQPDRGAYRAWKLTLADAPPALAPHGVRVIRVADLKLAAGPGLLPGLLEPSGGQPDAALTARVASPASVGEPAIEFD